MSPPMLNGSIAKNRFWPCWPYSNWHRSSRFSFPNWLRSLHSTRERTMIFCLSFARQTNDSESQIYRTISQCVQDIDDLRRLFVVRWNNQGQSLELEEWTDCRPLHLVGYSSCRSRHQWTAGNAPILIIRLWISFLVTTAHPSLVDDRQRFIAQSVLLILVRVTVCRCWLRFWRASLPVWWRWRIKFPF